MSLTRNTTGSINPATKLIDFNGETGIFDYYDKEKKENIELGTKIEFIVLNELSGITGWSDQDESAIWSNEVEKTTEEELTIRTKKGVLISGLYRKIKKDVISLGGKYCKIVYIKLKGEDTISRLRLKGAALSAWINKKINTKAQSIIVSGTEEGKKGSIKYKVPKFEAKDFDDKDYAKAVELDQELLAFLDERKETNNEKSEEMQEVVNDVFNDEPKEEIEDPTKSKIKTEDLPF